MATTTTSPAPSAQAFDWQAFVAGADPAEAIAAEAAKREAWLAQDPGTPIADGIAYLRTLAADRAMADLAATLGLTVEQVRERLVGPAPKASNGSASGGRMDDDAARAFIVQAKEDGWNKGKWKLITAFRDAGNPASNDKFGDLYHEVFG